MLAEALRQIEAALESDTIDDIGLVMSLRNVKVVTSIGRHERRDCGAADLWDQWLSPRRGSPVGACRSRRLWCVDHGEQRSLSPRERADDPRSQVALTFVVSSLPTLAYVYDPLSFAPLSIVEAAEGVCQLIWIVDGSKT